MTAVRLKSIEELTAPRTAWFSSNDEECWTGGPYDTREEAEAGADGEEHRLVTQATKTPIRVSRLFGAEHFLEGADEALYDYSNEEGDPTLDFTPAAILDLQARVRAAIDEWQVAHQLAPTAWAFTSCDEAEAAAWTKHDSEGAHK